MICLIILNRIHRWWFGEKHEKGRILKTMPVGSKALQLKSLSFLLHWKLSWIVNLDNDDDENCKVNEMTFLLSFLQVLLQQDSSFKTQNYRALLAHLFMDFFFFKNQFSWKWIFPIAGCLSGNNICAMEKFFLSIQSTEKLQ